ncbi:energy-coupling factor transport system ATP-binding protein [Trueperella bonasi]|uniref:Energy-coupling factor transport system ATP-binding protein n=1 Tax=Trueperella bonasi TaxID=312286 RepID=A0ABT9NEP9_9ACTO|nr:ABC transporter ATP-binding protein [Trueperella bonasi]MDP9805868.1 energy-coupling factor transport system ATP-binding protein [Trueperella bonasi]
MPEPLIELRDFTFRYRSQADPTLHGLNLVIRAGEKVAIVGRSGCGKSTLMNVLNSLAFNHHDGLIESGSVRVAGLDPSAAKLVDVSRHVGTVLQNSADQFVGLTVAEDIAFSLENQGVPQERMREAVVEAARRVGIDDQLESAPQDLSGGQKQRVAMAGVLVDDVDILLFDEPLAMLDPASGRDTIELIDRLNTDLGKTIIIVEHRLEEVLHRPVDRIVLINDGEILADLPPDKLISSGLLEVNGIRPPLHVTALRYAGIDILPEMQPSNAATTILSDADKARLRTWAGDVDTEPDSAETQAGLKPTDQASADQAPAEREGASRAIDVVDLSVAYEQNGDLPDIRVLNDVSTHVETGSMIGIVGSNGAGKSTLARAIAGFVEPNAGKVTINGEDAATWSLAEQGERVGFVLQEPGQMISTPYVREEIELGLKARGLADDDITQRADQAMRVCGLWAMRSWPISALSHGQKKRVTIAIMLALGPDILILDEPTAGQDFRHYTEFMDFLRELNGNGTTVILITHDMHLALEYTDRNLVISDGRIIADAHPSVVQTTPEVTRRADLVTTGLFTIAKRVGVDPGRLVRRFLAVDRKKRGQVGTGDLNG